jgi:hypothetical protein
MAEPIVPKSPPEESKKTESPPDSDIWIDEGGHLSSETREPIVMPEKIPPLIYPAGVGYLSGPADHFVGILEETVANLTDLHEDLRKLQEMLAKGGVR